MQRGETKRNEKEKISLFSLSLSHIRHARASSFHPLHFHHLYFHLGYRSTIPPSLSLSLSLSTKSLAHTCSNGHISSSEATTAILIFVSNEREKQNRKEREREKERKWRRACEQQHLLQYNHYQQDQQQGPAYHRLHRLKPRVGDSHVHRSVLPSRPARPIQSVRDCLVVLSSVLCRCKRCTMCVCA